MSERELVLNERAMSICACLGTCGIKHVDVRRYQVNDHMTTSIHASGDLGEGLVTVTAIEDGDVHDFMMQGPPSADGDHYRETRGSGIMYGVYRDVGHSLLNLLAEHPQPGSIDLPFAA